jgi:hypothetical protein
MPPTAAHRDAETRFRALLEDAELPAPDSVAYEEDSIVCFWDEPKLAVVVELEPRPG